MAYARMARTFGFLGRIFPNRANEDLSNPAQMPAPLEANREFAATVDTTGAIDFRPSRLGVVLPFIIAVIGLVGGILLAGNGQPVIGLIISLASLAGGLSSVFVYEAQHRRAVLRHMSWKSSCITKIPDGTTL